MIRVKYAIKILIKNNLVVECDIETCKKRIHIKCNLMNKTEFEKQKLCTKPFICIVCLQENIPFTKISDNEFDVCINKGIRAQLF